MTDITAAPGYLKIGSADFRLSPLRDKDWEELDNWVRYKFIERNKKALDYLSAVERDSFKASLLEAAAMLSWSSEVGRKIAFSHQGLLQVGWMMARLNQQVTQPDFEKMVKEANENQVLEDIDDLFVSLNFKDLVSKNGKNGDGKPSEKKSQKQKSTDS